MSSEISRFLWSDRFSLQQMKLMVVPRKNAWLIAKVQCRRFRNFQLRGVAMAEQDEREASKRALAEAKRQEEEERKRRLDDIEREERAERESSKLAFQKAKEAEEAARKDALTETPKEVFEAGRHAVRSHHRLAGVALKIVARGPGLQGGVVGQRTTFEVLHKDENARVHAWILTSPPFALYPTVAHAPNRAPLAPRRHRDVRHWALQDRDHLASHGIELLQGCFCMADRLHAGCGDRHRRRSASAVLWTRTDQR